MREWYTVTELAALALPGLPPAEKSLDNKARAEWRGNPMLFRLASTAGRPAYQYHIKLLPPIARQKLAYLSMPTIEKTAEEKRTLAELWARYEALTEEHKTICKTRLGVLVEVAEMEAAGIPVAQAVAVATKRAGASKSSYYEWKLMVEPYARHDWLPALAPAFSREGARSDCHADAWDMLKSDYLRSGAPAFTECYERMLKVAKREKWSPIPGERSLRRRMDAEVPKAVQKLAREGKDKAKALFPHQVRTRTHLHAMHSVNMDGHKLDVFVKVPWQEKPVRMYLLGIQDLYSGKVLAWRLSDAETWEAVRLVIGDMVEHFGIPDHIYLDNGRAFASKWISGQSRTRFRFKVRDEDPRGLLTTLGIEPHWTTPYSGQSKPIERAWRDLAEMIAKHPFCAGAYTGNRPDAKPEDYGTRAVPLDDMRAHVAVQVADHNARAGRKAKTCAGRSFDETFTASMETAIVRYPTAAQKSLWLLASETLRTNKDAGTISFQGNRYWSRELNQYAGKKLIVRFDPDALKAGIKVYDLDDSFICEAPCIEDTGFDSRDAARLHKRARRDHVKAVEAERAAHKTLVDRELAELIYPGGKPVAPDVQPVRPAVTRLPTRGNLAVVPSQDIMSDDEIAARFTRSVNQLAGTDGIILFPDQNGDRPAGSASGRKYRAEK